MFAQPRLSAWEFIKTSHQTGFQEEPGERSSWVPLDEVGGNCVTWSLKLISAPRGSVRDSKVLPNKQGKDSFKKWSQNSKWPTHAYSPRAFLAPRGKDFRFAVFRSLRHEGRGSKTVVEEPPLKEGAIGFKHGAQGEGSDPLPITNILLPFQEGGQGESPSGTSSSLTTVHRLPKPRAWEPAPLRDLLTSPRRLLYTERGRMRKNKTPHHPTAAKRSSQGSLSQGCLVRQLHAEKPLQMESLALPVCSCPQAGPLPGLCHTARVGQLASPGNTSSGPLPSFFLYEQGSQECRQVPHSPQVRLTLTDPGNQVADLPPNVHVSLNQGVRPQKSDTADREDIAHFSLVC